MNRRNILVSGMAGIVCTAGARKAIALAPQQIFTWQHWSFVQTWPGKGHRVHICVRGETREASFERLAADDPVWSNASQVKYHGPFTERVVFRPLPDRFIGWTGAVGDLAKEITEQREQRIAALITSMA